MKILVVGSGGREHALAWKLAQPRHVEAVFVAPGNAGTALEAGLTNVTIDVMDFAKLADFAEGNGIGLCVIGPEAPLCGGIVDYFGERGLACFGPHQAAAQLEGLELGREVRVCLEAVIACCAGVGDTAS